MSPQPQTVIPPENLQALGDLSGYLDQLSEPAALVGPDGQTLPLPQSLYDALVAAATALRSGRAVMVAPVDQVMTTQQAADFLGISRPTLVKMLEAGEIAYTKPSGSRHRRVLLRDLIDYQHRHVQRRHELLDALTQEAQAAGLYDATPETYADALREVRHRTA